MVSQDAEHLTRLTLDALHQSGQRVFEMGVGPRPIPQRQLTSDFLTQALRTLVTDAAMQQRAADLGASIRDEQGVACAVEVLRQRWLE